MFPNASSNAVRAACTKCGYPGHFTYQCRNFFRVNPNEDIVLDVSSTSSFDSDDAEITKEPLKQPEKVKKMKKKREHKSKKKHKSKHSEPDCDSEKQSKSKHKRHKKISRKQKDDSFSSSSDVSPDRKDKNHRDVEYKDKIKNRERFHSKLTEEHRIKRFDEEDKHLTKHLKRKDSMREKKDEKRHHRSSFKEKDDHYHKRRRDY
ncbi:hypothetical protein QR98_0082200 [Sarcoptes scabiei]|uniref:Protein SREK1IP1 n=1 Tax=Sarcoptes scabiei TaxID=52283 RepID=A0A132AFG8_SARSC|nr:hypothetical protein QR98_0082200 [Sarcoptes scabiei]